MSETAEDSRTGETDVPRSSEFGASAGQIGGQPERPGVRNLIRRRHISDTSVWQGLIPASADISGAHGRQFRSNARARTGAGEISADGVVCLRPGRRNAEPGPQFTDSGKADDLVLDSEEASECIRVCALRQASLRALTAPELIVPDHSQLRISGAGETEVRAKPCVHRRFELSRRRRPAQRRWNS